jgi:succinoglycan biosynthesis transport protein ExoP
MSLPAVPPPSGPPLLPALPQPPAVAGAPGPVPLWPGVSAEHKLELLEYWRSITRRKWAIAALVLAVAALAALVSMAMTPVYRATATVLVEGGRVKVVSVEEVYGSASQMREHLQTQAELLRSREVAMRTVKALKLWDHPQFDPRQARPGWTQRLMASAGIGRPPQVRTDWTQEELAELAADRLLGGVSVAPVRMSRLIKVSFESSDPQLAARVANGVAQQYIESDLDERSRMTSQVSRQLQEQLQSLRQKLADSERALQAYREKRGIVSIGGSAQANASQQMSGLTERMLQARARRIELESSYEQVRGIAPAQYASVPTVVRDPGVLEAQRVRNAAVAKLDELQSRLGPAHDQVVQAAAEVTSTTAQLQQRQAAVVQALVRDYEAARDTEQAIERSMGVARAGAQSVNREEFGLAVLEREYQSNRQLYDVFMSRAKETSAIGEVQAAVARISDPAPVPRGAIKPDRNRIVMVAALVALLVGALAAIVIDRLDNTVKGADDAERRLHAPVLASLPQMPAGSRADMARQFLTDNHSNYAEGIRTARTGVLLSDIDAAHKTLLVTSSIPGEGKTTVAVNLALAHAQANGRTLLIDCDMRRAQASRNLGLGAARLGLTHLAAGQAQAQDCIVPIEDTGLWVLPVGEPPPNPLELLHARRFREMLDELSAQYPMIVIDSPPVELVSEALVLAPQVTSVALVVKAMSTPAPLVRKTQLRLQRAGGRLLGVVVNGLDFDEARAYYGEYAHAGYSYAYQAGGEPDGPQALAGSDRRKGQVARLIGALPAWKRGGDASGPAAEQVTDKAA